MPMASKKMKTEPIQNDKTSNQTQQHQHQQHKRNNASRSKKRPRLDKERAQIVIVGSGLAGLSAAISLQRAGFQHISVLERDISFDRQKEGYGLTLTYNPKGPLASLGVLERVAEEDCPSRSHYLFRPDGSILGYYGNAFVSHRGHGQRGNLRIPRKVLRKILIQQSTKSTNDDDDDDDSNTKAGNSTIKIFWGTKLIDYRWDAIQQHYKLMTTMTKNDGDHSSFPPSLHTPPAPPPTYADLLIAADGIRSTILHKLYENYIPTQPRGRNTIKRQQEHCDTNISPSTISRNGNDDQSKTTKTSTSSSLSFSIGNFTRLMGVRLILGIANFSHPLLRERGFYTLDGKHRLFTMPYHSSRFDDIHGSRDKSSTCINHNKNNNDDHHQDRIMWQLSFATDGNDDDDTIHNNGSHGDDNDGDDDEERKYSNGYRAKHSNNSNKNNKNKQLDSISLRDYVIQTCKNWHAPVLKMIEATPLDTIWGTDLLDRDPNDVLKVVQDSKVQRLVVIGDALHPMSPFKGQGANQALADGPLLASWLERASIDSAVKGFWRETVQRTAPIVHASRAAAMELHSPNVLNQLHGFAGIRTESVSSFLSLLKEKGIGANVTEKQETNRMTLEDRILSIIKSSNHSEADKVRQPESEQQAKSLVLAATGNTQGLREVSLSKHSESIRTAKDFQSRTCLHLAALGGHVSTCKWLLTEVECDFRAIDSMGNTPMDYATDEGLDTVLGIIQILIQEEELERSRTMATI